MTERDINIIELTEGATAVVHQEVYLGEVLIAQVKVGITVLGAEDGTTSLLVDQETDLTPAVSLDELRSHS